MAIYALAFVILVPLEVGAARFTVSLNRADPTPLGGALAAVSVIGAAVAVFLGLVSGLYIVGATSLVAVLSAGVIPAFIGLEALLLVIPGFLRRSGGGGE